MGGGPAQSFQQTGGPAQSFQGGDPAQSFVGYQQAGGQPLMGYDPQMGGQPPMGYDPQMGQYDPQSFAIQQAEAELAALEEKKKAKDEAAKQKEIEHLSHKLRSGARDQKDNQACARTLCMWAVFNGLLYGLALMGDSWWTVTWQAMSIDELELRLGLFNLQVNLKCKDTVDMKYCNMMHKWADHDAGQWSTKEIRDKMCEEEKNACPTVDRLYYAGFPPLVLFPLAAAFECLSLLLLYFYWHASPTSMVRVLADKCAVMACMSGAAGIVGWFAMKPWLTGLPRLWAEMAGQGNASGVFTGFKETWSIPCGWCLVAAGFALCGSFARMISQYNLPFHVDEPDPYGLDERVNLMEEAKKEAERTYGASSS